MLEFFGFYLEGCSDDAVEPVVDICGVELLGFRVMPTSHGEVTD